MKRMYNIFSLIFIIFYLFLSSLAFAGTIQYEYDDLHRLISVEYSDGSVTEYEYDNLGNRLSKTVTPGLTPLSAGFTTLPAMPANGSFPFSVSFTDTSTGDITSWTWDFGDGQTAAEQNPVHIYNEPGAYTVSLTIRGDNGTDTYEDNITLIQDEIYCFYSLSPASASFEWEGGSGTIGVDANDEDCSWSVSSNVSWISIASETGGTGDGMVEYSVSENQDGFSRTGILTIGDQNVSITQADKIANSPIACFSASETEGDAPFTVAFTDQSTGKISDWLWSFGDGATSSYEHPSHTFEQPGSYTVLLTVSGSGGEDTFSITIVVNNTTSPPFMPSFINYPLTDEDGTFTVSWDAVTNANTYEVQRDSDSLFSNPVTIYSGSNTSFTETALSQGTYYYRVKAENDSGSSDWKNGNAIDVDGGTTEVSITNLSIPDTTACPGGTVTIDLELINAEQTELAAFASDIIYDSSLLSAPCAELGPAGEDAEKSVISNEIDENTLKIALISMQNNSPISDGVVAHITFDVDEDVVIGTEIQIDQVSSGSDPDGNAIEVEGRSGTITVIACCLGDCDNNGKVTISEVQGAVNQFLGTVEVQPCNDQNGDEKLGISELQQIINNFLQGCE